MFISISAGIVTFFTNSGRNSGLYSIFIGRRKLQASRLHEDVKQHQAKAGTPTMGGLVFLIATVVVSFLVALFSKQLTIMWE